MIRTKAAATIVGKRETAEVGILTSSKLRVDGFSTAL